MIPMNFLSRRTRQLFPCLFAAWLGLSVSPLFASGPGTTAATILQMPVGARAVAMGEAYTAQADDVSSLYWNPAGLAILNQSQADFSYNQLLEGLSYSHAGVATPLENGGIGASLSYLSYGNINGFNDQNQPTGNINAYSGVATVGGGWLGNFWSAGVNLKAIQGALSDVKATGFAADFGLNLIYPQEVLGGTLRAGATLRNVGQGMKYLQESDPLPTEWRLGVAAVQMLDRKLNLSMDFGESRDSNGSFYTGAEYWLFPFVALRAGYAGTSAEGSGIRAGLGLKYRDFSFDYAYSPYGDLGMTNRYEVTMRFGAIRPLLSPEERKLLQRGKQALRQGKYDEAVMLFNSLIELEPSYKPVRRLIKVAMAGSEKDDRMASNMKFKYNAGERPGAPDTNPGEASELEQLLNLGNDGTMQAKVMKHPVAAKE